MHIYNDEKQLHVLHCTMSLSTNAQKRHWGHT